MHESEYEHVLPKAERTFRQWSLGFALPAKNGGDMIDKTKTRTQKAGATAHKVAALPHDMREPVLRTVHPTQYAYGREYVLMDNFEIDNTWRELEVCRGVCCCLAQAPAVATAEQQQQQQQSNTNCLIKVVARARDQRESTQL